MRSWVFRNRRRLEALLGSRGPAAVSPAPAERVARASLAPRVVVLVPARRLARDGR